VSTLHIWHSVIQRSHLISITLSTSLGRIMPLVQAWTSNHVVKLSWSHTCVAMYYVLTSVLNVVLCKGVSRIKRSTISANRESFVSNHCARCCPSWHDDDDVTTTAYRRRRVVATISTLSMAWHLIGVDDVETLSYTTCLCDYCHFDISFRVFVQRTTWFLRGNVSFLSTALRNHTAVCHAFYIEINVF